MTTFSRRLVSTSLFGYNCFDFAVGNIYFFLSWAGKFPQINNVILVSFLPHKNVSDLVRAERRGEWSA
jgi:hypothetical protein